MRGETGQHRGEVESRLGLPFARDPPRPGTGAFRRELSPVLYLPVSMVMWRMRADILPGKGCPGTLQPHPPEQSPEPAEDRGAWGTCVGLTGGSARQPAAPSCAAGGSRGGGGLRTPTPCAPFSSMSFFCSRPRNLRVLKEAFCCNLFSHSNLALASKYQIIFV